jgi:hemerythrin-like domain-containing protein
VIQPSNPFQYFILALVLNPETRTAGSYSQTYLLYPFIPGGDITMSIYSYLQEEHEEVKAIMNDIETLGDKTDESRTSLFAELKEKLLTHAKAEEKTFYETLRKYSEAKEKITHAKKEHQEVEMLLNELSSDQLHGAAWQQKFLKLKNAVEHHIEEEEGTIFTLAKQLIDPKTAEELENDMEEKELEVTDEVA